MKRILALGLAGLIVVALAASGVVIYVVTRPPALPINLAVSDGSTLGAIEGNFTNITDTRDALVLQFGATVYANQSGVASSKLSIHVWTETYYDAVAGAMYQFDNVTIMGRFASNLRPSGLQLTLNETGPAIGLHTDILPQGANVSFNSEVVTLYQDGTTNLSATLINGGAAAPFDFGYYTEFNVVWRPWYNHFVGFRATVTGPFTPAVGVGILLKIINTSGGTWV